MADARANAAGKNPKEMDRDQQAIDGGQYPFPRAARLLKPVEFKRVFKNPVVSSDRFFRVLGNCNDTPVSRLGMAVSRHVDKRAVRRNRIKRVIRESFRHTYLTVPKVATAKWINDGQAGLMQPGTDLVVLPRRESATISNKQLFTSLNGHWSRIKEALERKRESIEQNTP
jgi:ribonuclease P protein component